MMISLKTFILFDFDSASFKLRVDANTNVGSSDLLTSDGFSSEFFADGGGGFVGAH